jgi:hypothetical protein
LFRPVKNDAHPDSTAAGAGVLDLLGVV